MNIRIANRLLEYRRANGYSQEELAEKLGVSRQAVSKWERAEASPDTDNLIALASLYGVTIDELINGRDEPKGKDAGCGGADGDNAGGNDSGVGGNDSGAGNDGDNCDSENAADNDSKKTRRDKVRIGRGGIHIDDKDGDHVHIDLHGIHVDDKDGTHVHIGGEGVVYGDDHDEHFEIDTDDDDDDHASTCIKDGRLYVDDEYVCNVRDGDKIKIRGGHVYVNGRERRAVNEAFNWLNASVPLLCVIAYLLMGFLTPWGWRIGWLVFFLIPIIPSLVSAIRRRKASRFAYPLFVTGVYLLLGMWLGLWHPWWILFLTIPVYYTLCSTIEHIARRK